MTSVVPTSTGHVLFPCFTSFYDLKMQRSAFFCQTCTGKLQLTASRHLKKAGVFASKELLKKVFRSSVLASDRTKQMKKLSSRLLRDASCVFRHCIDNSKLLSNFWNWIKISLYLKLFIIVKGEIDMKWWAWMGFVFEYSLTGHVTSVSDVWLQEC